MEIVAPAGSMSRLKAAVSAGAGEVYLGLKGFGARRNAENFNVKELMEAIDYSHSRGTRVFLTLNTMMKSRELAAVYTNLKTVYEAGLDAVIVQDFGVFKFLKDNFPDLEVHGSTQMTVANHVEANYLKAIGFKRVVLARELSFEEIKNIREKTEIELEIFVSGALCISYSGNCYLSSFIGGRSGNRGLCAQPCRRQYLTKKSEKSYLLSPKDQIFEKEEIEKLKEIGIDSIKIEGRMKSEEYVYETVSYYNGLIKGVSRELNTLKIFNRGYGKGYFYNNLDIMNPEYSADFGYRVGRVSGSGEVILEDSLSLGDGIAYISKNYQKLGGTYVNKISKEKDKKEKAVKGELVWLGKLPKGTAYIYKTYSKDIMDLVSREMKGSEKRIPIRAKLTAIVGDEASLEVFATNLYGEEVCALVYSGETLEMAKSSPLSLEKLEEKVGELGETTFFLEKFDFVGELGAFLPFKTLKAMKRAAVEELREKLLCSYRREKAGEEMITCELKNSFNPRPRIAVCVFNLDQERAARKFGVDKIYKKGIDVAMESQLHKIDLGSELASNLYQLLENKNSTVAVDWNQNIGNSYTLDYFSGMDKVGLVYLSPELDLESFSEIKGAKVEKGLVVYGRLRVMYIDPSIVGEDCKVVSESGDELRLVKNYLGNTEVYFEKPMNLIPVLDKILKLGVDELRLDFTWESYDETLEVLKSLENRGGEYNPYNFDRGVY